MSDADQQSVDTWFEIHAEHDGHVTGAESREKAEEMVEELDEKHKQNHEIVEVLY